MRWRVEQISIVKDTPGVTRDRIYADVEWLNHKFTLIDTGGIEPESKRYYSLAQMREQAQIAMDTADVIIFMTDVRQGLVDADAKVADMLRRSHKPVHLSGQQGGQLQEVQMADVLRVLQPGHRRSDSQFPPAAQLGIGDMLDEVVKHFDEDQPGRG